MTMRLLACLFLLVIVPPVPGQAPNQPADNSGNPKADRREQKQPSNGIAPSSPIQPSGSKVSQDGGAEQKKGNSPVSISTASPLDIRTDVQKDWMDRVNWIFTGILVAIGGFGVWYARKTLKAIKEQADSLKQQVEDARRTNAETAVTASGTLRAIERQASLMEGQILEMQQAGKQAAKHLSLIERPWISPAVALIGPLIFDDNGLRITIRIALSNVGKSPAIGIWANLAFYLPYRAERTLEEERNLMCQRTSAGPVPWGRILFPGSPPYNQDMNFGASVQDVERATIGDRETGLCPAQIILCVAYRSTLDETARHFTAVVYELSRIDPGHPNTKLVLPARQSIPLQRLHLDTAFVLGPIAE